MCTYYLSPNAHTDAGLRTEAEGEDTRCRRPRIVDCSEHAGEAATILRPELLVDPDSVGRLDLGVDRGLRARVVVELLAWIQQPSDSVVKCLYTGAVLGLEAVCVCVCVS